MKKYFLLLAFLGIWHWSALGQTATFEITYQNSTPEIEAAVDYATGLWGQYLISNVPIKIHVNITQVPLFLGVSLSNAQKNFPNAPMQDVWYPTSLANAMANMELNPGESDMEITMGAANWYFGTDGNPASNQQDFVSVFLHEVCHSLGIVSLSNKENAEGTFGEVSPSDLGIIPSSFTFSDLESLPGIFDIYLINGAGNSLVDTMLFPNGSATLGGQLTSNNLFFNGDSAVAAYGGFPARIYAPSTFTLGSSCSHLDEMTYNSTPNSMMTPFSAAGDVMHNPGPIIIGALYDIGWNQYDHPPSATQNPIAPSLQVSASPNPFTNQTTLSYTLEENADLQIKIFNQKSQQIHSELIRQQAPGSYLYEWNASEIPPGFYYYQITTQNTLQTIPLIKTN